MKFVSTHINLACKQKKIKITLFQAIFAVVLAVFSNQAYGQYQYGFQYPSNQQQAYQPQQAYQQQAYNQVPQQSNFYDAFAALGE